eukprot:scaffold296812_cov42-Prasinocladus_malaysianus.AAC.2
MPPRSGVDFYSCLLRLLTGYTAASARSQATHVSDNPRPGACWSFAPTPKVAKTAQSQWVVVDRRMASYFRSVLAVATTMSLEALLDYLK